MFARALFALVLVSLLASCGGAASAPTAPPAAEPTAAPTEAATEAPAAEPTNAPTEAPAADEPSGSVSFMVFGDPAEKAAYETLVASFEERHPEIDIEVQHIPSQSDYRQRLGADFAAGTPADVVLINYRRYAPFAARDALEPLGPYLEQSELIKTDDFYPESLVPFTWEGTLMCIPQNLSSLVVYYNKNLFDEAGLAYPGDSWTWEEFVETAKALTKDVDGDGATDQFGLGTTVEAIRIAPFVWQNGGAIVDDDTNPTRLTFDSPEATAAFQWFADLQVVHKVAPSAAEEEAEDSESRFLNGRTAMFLNSRRGVPTYREIEEFDWDVAPLPHSGTPATVLHADAYCLPAASENKPAAWKFIEFANSPEGQTIIARTGRTVPSIKAVAESDAFLDPQVKPSRSKVFLDVIPETRAVPVMATWPEIEEILTTELQRAFYGEATAEEAIATLIEQTERYFTAAP